MVVMETELVERGRVWGHHRRAGDWHRGGSAPFNYQNTILHGNIDRQPFCPEMYNVIKHKRIFTF